MNFRSFSQTLNPMEDDLDILQLEGASGSIPLERECSEPAALSFMRGKVHGVLSITKSLIKKLGARFLTGSEEHEIPSFISSLNVPEAPSEPELVLVKDDFNGTCCYWISDEKIFRSSIFFDGTTLECQSQNCFTLYGNLAGIMHPHENDPLFAYLGTQDNRRCGMIGVSNIWLSETEYSRVVREFCNSFCWLETSEYLSEPIIAASTQNRILLLKVQTNIIDNTLLITGGAKGVAPHANSRYMLAGLSDGTVLKIDMCEASSKNGKDLPREIIHLTSTWNSPAKKILTIDNQGSYLFYENNAIAYLDSEDNDKITLLRIYTHERHPFLVYCKLHDDSVLVNFGNEFNIYFKGIVIRTHYINKFAQYIAIAAIPKNWEAQKTFEHDYQWIIGLRKETIEVFPLLLGSTLV